MKIKKDESLEKLSFLIGLSQKSTEAILLKHSFDSGIIDGDKACYGLKMKQAVIDYDETLTDMFELMFGPGVMNEDTLNSFGEITFIGNYGCPECGGEVIIKTEGGKMYQHDYDSEPYVDGGSEYLECTHCKTII